MDNRGQGDARLISHILLWIALVIVVAWLIWSATHGSTQNNRFAPGATVNDNHSTRWPFTLDLNFSCVPKEIMNQRTKEERDAAKGTELRGNSEEGNE